MTKKTSMMEEESDDSDYGEDMLTMVEADDLEFLKAAINSQSYGILKRIKHGNRNEVKAKRKRPNRSGNVDDDDETMEHEYEDQVETSVELKDLLPIKTRKGIVKRSIKTRPAEDSSVTQGDESGSDESREEEYVLEGPELNKSVPKSLAELLGAYSETLQNKKLEIGALCTALLENPEEKVLNLKSLLQILNEFSGEARLSVRKLVLISLLEVFKDILPSYQIKHHDTGGAKLKKDTLKLQQYEDTLLLYYKKYLQRLEKFSAALYKKRARDTTESQKKLGELSVQAMCDLLVAHPYFNFAPNIAQAVVPFLNHASPSIRQSVSSACKTIFKEDKKEEITLKILRVLNCYVKNHTHRIRPDVLEVLLHLRIKDVNLDTEREHEIKQKKLMAKKQNILQLSKKERKRKKRLQQLEKEMLETKAEENKQNKQKNLTEIVKIVFGIYFRILKSCSTTNVKVLGVCLEGLARYSHCINLDYYMDLLKLLDGLLKQDSLGFREQLHCIQTVFAILSEQGDALNLDPSRFYTALYKNLLATRAPDVPAVLKTLDDMLIKRRKKITNKRLIGFTKRTATLALQLSHNGALGCLGVVKSVLQLNKMVDVLLDLDVTIGDGDYQAELDDPEYCNAASTSLYELALLTHHYHPVVGKFARHIAGEANLPLHYNKLSPEQLYEEFDPSLMAFNPAVPVPKQTQRAKPRHDLQFTDANFQSYCDGVLRRKLGFLS